MGEKTQIHLEPLQDYETSGLNKPFEGTNSISQLSAPEILNTMSSRIICSSTITRENIKDKELTSNIENGNPDEDEQFYSSLRAKIRKDYSMQSKENFLKPLKKNSYSQRKRKSPFDERSEHIMKLFKENMQNKNLKSKPRNNLTAQPNNIIGKIVAENQGCTGEKLIESANLKSQNLFTPSNFNIDTKSNAANKVLFQVTSKTYKDSHVVASTKKTTILEREVEELLYYELQCITPPHSGDEA